LLLALGAYTAGAQSVLPEWLMGQWQPNRSAYGTDPENYCLLTISRNQVSWREYPSAPSRIYSVEVVVTDEDFIVLKAEHEYGSDHFCLRMPSPSYMRIDGKDYFTCLQVATDCPRPFARNQSFELTAFSSLEDAMRHAGSAQFWTGYRMYE